VFTGDSSGDWLYRALHAAGFANRAESHREGDGLRLQDARVTCVVRCAPPQNRPTAEEQALCRDVHLLEELRACRRVRVVIALGRIAFEGYRRAWESLGGRWRHRPVFAHGTASASLDGRRILLASYHPSRQNTQTGRLTRAMFDQPFVRARTLLEETS
jgi:uracil-DNA glycosylase family 4